MGSGASGHKRAGATENNLIQTKPISNMLEKMYHIMEGPKWVNSSGGWGTEGDDLFNEPDFSDYKGLGVNAYNQVIRITLPRNNVGGYLPFSEKFIDTMIELRTVDLENNRVGKDFPPSWCLLTNLTDLNLTRNNLRGTLPDSIGNLATLKKLKVTFKTFLHLFIGRF
jgi:Leucine-rich repeat (LRR) protein